MDIDVFVNEVLNWILRVGSVSVGLIFLVEIRVNKVLKIYIVIIYVVII